MPKRRDRIGGPHVRRVCVFPDAKVCLQETWPMYLGIVLFIIIAIVPKSQQCSLLLRQMFSCG